MIATSEFKLNPRRGVYINIQDCLDEVSQDWKEPERKFWDQINLVYRTLCAVLFNFVPTSGHPGGSISSGQIVQGIIFQTMDYDFTDPDRVDNDIITYAAGHKAMGLYAMWALRNELVRISRPDLLAPVIRQLRWEDLLGFRRNPTNETPLFREFHSRPLDGHPTCATPFMKVATGASGVGIPAGLGLGMAARDYFGNNAPWLHLVEGEGGMTPGRVQEAMAAAATMQLSNAVMHIDWNQASIDSNRVCAENGKPGDYVQWNPAEIAYVHDWNVIFVTAPTDFRQTLAAQKLALSLGSTQPTAIVYRTVKGWKYGIEGSASHGAGHKFASDGYYKSLTEFETLFNVTLPRFTGDQNPSNVERNYYDTLMAIRAVLEKNQDLASFAGKCVSDSRSRLNARMRKPVQNAPHLSSLYTSPEIDPLLVPPGLQFKSGSSVTTRAALGDALNVLNRHTGGAIMAVAADLAGSTSISNAVKGFGEGFFNTVSNPKSRLVPIGGICEDAMGAWMAGLSSFGKHIGVTASYGAFLAALEHVAARLHGIGQQTNEFITGEPYKTWIMINAHSGVKTGEDGPTHADPQALQLLQECFPGKVCITLTPWDVCEIWPLLIAGLFARPAILAPFVTRPADTVVDRKALRLPPVEAAVKGVYALRRSDPTSEHHGTLVLQGNGVGTTFIQDVLPTLDREGWNLNIFYIASMELFNLLNPAEQDEIFPESLTAEAVGITDFTLPTLYRWVRSNDGMRRTLHSFRSGHYLGSGSAAKVLEEAGIHAAGQLQMIRDYAKWTFRRTHPMVSV